MKPLESHEMISDGTWQFILPSGNAMLLKAVVGARTLPRVQLAERFNTRAAESLRSVRYRRWTHGSESTVELRLYEIIDRYEA